MIRKKASSNILYTGDNLFVMNGMNSQTVDLIYLDPPFNSKRFYSAPVGSKAAGASFKDMWTWDDVDSAYLDKLMTEQRALAYFIDSVQEIHGKGMASYLSFMAQRIIEMRRILKPTGSIYLHCDPTASHYLKIILDNIFGRNNYRNEIMWSYRTGGASKRSFSKKHDVILFYSKTNRYNFFPQQEKAYTKSKGRTEGVIDYGAGTAEFFRDDEGVYNYVAMRDAWEISYINSRAKERTGYPTQKPLALLHRIIKASSKQNDIVFDPFCGCATTMVAAQQLNRKWIGIDIEAKSAELVVQRLADDSGLFRDFVHTKRLPVRTDIKIERPSPSVKERLYKIQKGICIGCSNELDIRHFHIDHIIPKSKGGQDVYENYQLLCGNCNSIKGNRPMEYLRAKMKAREVIMRNITYD